MTTWEQQQEKDLDWYKAHINKKIAMQLHSDYFTMIYKIYCGSLHPIHFKSALEIGISDTGGYLSVIPNIKKRVGLDPAVNHLRKVDMLPLVKHIRYVNAYAEKIPFKNNAFDLVIASNALDHVKDMKKSVKEMDRVLMPGGYVLFATFLKVKNPHPWTWQTGAEARKMFKKYDAIEQHEVKDQRPFFRRNDAYIAVFKKT